MKTSVVLLLLTVADAFLASPRPATRSIAFAKKRGFGSAPARARLSHREDDPRRECKKRGVAATRMMTTRRNETEASRPTAASTRPDRGADAEASHVATPRRDRITTASLTQARTNSRSPK